MPTKKTAKEKATSTKTKAATTKKASTTKSKVKPTTTKTPAQKKTAKEKVTTTKTKAATTTKSKAKSASTKTPKAKVASTKTKTATTKKAAATQSKRKTTATKTTAQKKTPKAKVTTSQSKTSATKKTTAKKSEGEKQAKRSIQKLLKQQPLPFPLNSYIFYPNEGLGLITNLEQRKFNDEDTLYYEITFQNQKMTSRIPVKNVKMLKLRKVISKSTAQKILKLLSVEQKPFDFSWKDRLNLYQGIIKKGSAIETVKIVTSLYLRKQIKSLSYQERHHYEFALEALTGEIAIAFNIEKEAAAEKVNEALKKLTPPSNKN